MGKIYGLRWDDRKFEIGEELPKSNRWDDGVDTGEELNGTCAIEDRYNSSHLYLVEIESSWGWEWGEDEGEIVMNGAEVVRRIR